MCNRQRRRGRGFLDPDCRLRSVLPDVCQHWNEALSSAQDGGEGTDFSSNQLATSSTNPAIGLRGLAAANADGNLFKCDHKPPVKAAHLAFRSSGGTESPPVRSDSSSRTSPRIWWIVAQRLKCISWPCLPASTAPVIPYMTACRVRSSAP